MVEDSTKTLSAETSLGNTETIPAGIVTCQPQSSQNETTSNVQPLNPVWNISFVNPTYEGPQELSVVNIEASQDVNPPNPDIVREISTLRMEVY